jgi:hypothetical protein
LPCVKKTLTIVKEKYPPPLFIKALAILKRLPVCLNAMDILKDRGSHAGGTLCHMIGVEPASLIL